MSKKVYTLKHATPRMKHVHMNHMMEFKDQLKEHQDKEAKRKYSKTLENLIVCQKIADMTTASEYSEWWNSTPDDNDGFLNAAREKLQELEDQQPMTYLNVTISIPEMESDAAESDRIDRWLSDNWESVPEIEF